MPMFARSLRDTSMLAGRTAPCREIPVDMGTGGGRVPRPPTGLIALSGENVK